MDNYYYFFSPTCLVTTWREKIRETENLFGLALVVNGSRKFLELRTSTQVCKLLALAILKGGGGGGPFPAR